METAGMEHGPTSSWTQEVAAIDRHRRILGELHREAVAIRKLSNRFEIRHFKGKEHFGQLRGTLPPAADVM